MADWLLVLITEKQRIMLNIKKLFCLTSAGLLGFSCMSWAQSRFFNENDRYPDDPLIHCDSMMPNTSDQAKKDYISKWSAFISKQAFTIPSTNINQHLERIHSCFSNEGWTEYSNAMKRSGNINLIITKKYSGTSSIEGIITISHNIGSKLWETNTPLYIVYQNKESRVLQRVFVHLRINELNDGRLRIVQIVGIPRDVRNKQEDSITPAQKK